METESVFYLGDGTVPFRCTRSQVLRVLREKLGLPDDATVWKYVYQQWSHGPVPNEVLLSDAVPQPLISTLLTCIGVNYLALESAMEVRKVELLLEEHSAPLARVA